MIAAVEAGICKALYAIPGVAAAKPYAGELTETHRSALQVPALLVALSRLTTEPDVGSGEVLAQAEWSCFIITRQALGPEWRGETAWALAEAVLIAARAATWGVAGCSPAERVWAAPLWQLEGRGLAVREVRWTNLLRLGESEWVGGAAPTEVYLGYEPYIGAAHVDKYFRIDEEELPE